MAADVEPRWYSIEVLDGRSSAGIWSEIFGDSLVAEALSHRAQEWSWHRHPWGVVFEVAFSDEEAWALFRESLTVLRALDAAPDPVSGVIIYPGRGGSSSSRQPRRPRPLSGAGSASLPLPVDDKQYAVFPAALPRLIARS